jgi:hypothetical protein
MRSLSSVVKPGRSPASTWAWRTQFRKLTMHADLCGDFLQAADGATAGPAPLEYESHCTLAHLIRIAW